MSLFCVEGKSKFFSYVIGILVFVFAFAVDVHAQTRPNIMTWGTNMPEWNQSLGLTGNREGCHAAPAQCVSNMEGIAASENVNQMIISMPFDLTTAVSYATQYSQLSLTHKIVIGIGFDDFVNTIENLQIAGKLSNPASFVSTVITATKSKNPNLKFGVTIYEDSLTHAVLTNTVLPAALRAKIDYVHLFVHYRANAPNYATYVSQAKTIFPNAKIMAGAYPYDRIDYLPCQFKGTVHCTASQEQSLYKQLLQIQANLLKQGTVSGIEFFFGYFGMPQDWAGWTAQTRVCNPARLTECYSNSEKLQEISKEVLQATFAGNISLPYKSIFMGKQPVGTLSTVPFKLIVTNTGSGSVTISSIGVGGVNSSNFPITNNCGTTIPGGKSCTVTIYFKPTASGTRSGTLLINDNAGTGTQNVTLTGTATP